MPMITAEEVAENRRKVLAALRSGIPQCYCDYVQGECRCATAVVMEALGRTWQPNEADYLGGKFSHGVRTAPALGVGINVVYQMIDQNDLMKRTFPEIADWLEQEFTKCPITEGATYET